jgi:hypothetical protein
MRKPGSGEATSRLEVSLGVDSHSTLYNKSEYYKDRLESREQQTQTKYTYRECKGGGRDILDIRKMTEGKSEREEKRTQVNPWSQSQNQQVEL